MALGCSKTKYLFSKDAAELRTRWANQADPAPVTCYIRLQEVRPDLSAYLHAWIWLKEHGVMPDAGGYHDQDARWVQAMDVCRRNWASEDAE